MVNQHNLKLMRFPTGVHVRQISLNSCDLTITSVPMLTSDYRNSEHESIDIPLLLIRQMEHARNGGTHITTEAMCCTYNGQNSLQIYTIQINVHVHI